MDYQKHKHKLALSHFQKIGPITYKKLLKKVSEKEIFTFTQKELIQLGIKEQIANDFIKFKKEFNFDKIIQKLKKENISLVGINDSNYPPLLKEIYDPPFLLYYKGKIDNDVFYKLSIAVVGSRKFTHYGEQVCAKIVGDLSEQNINIISGMAIGIDTLAHLNALKKHTKTIAVLGSGIDEKSIYPKRNKNLAEKIIKNNGLIISEFPPNTPPNPFNFPRRNRIVAGLSNGVLLIEAEEKSGSLITARLALEQNREVFAIPGNIFSPNQKGTNNLIKQGATLVADASDILDAFNIQKEKQNSPKNIELSPDEQKIMQHIDYEGVHIDEIIRNSSLPSAQISSLLTIMELKGLVKNIGAMKYIINI